MKFKIVENLPKEVADAIRELGYDAHTVIEEELGGAKDPKIMSVCRAEGHYH